MAVESRVFVTCPKCYSAEIVVKVYEPPTVELGCCRCHNAFALKEANLTERMMEINPKE